MPIEPSGKLGLPKAGKVCQKAIRAGKFAGPITADKKLEVLGFPDPGSIEDSLIPNLVRFTDNEGAELDPQTLTLTPKTQFGEMQVQVADAPLAPPKD